MPQIKPYELQTNISNLPESRQVRAEDFQAPARGLERVADAGQQLSDVLAKRAEQQEVSDLHVKLSKAMAESTVEYQKQLLDGSLNTEKFTEDFNTKIDQLGDETSTPGGSLYFKEASGKMKAHFLEQAALGQAQLAGAKAKSDYQESLNYGSSTLMADPSSYTTVKDLQMKLLDSYVKSNSLPYEKALELKRVTENKLGEGAVRGWIKLNPEYAKQILDNGEFNKNFDEDVKKQLYGEADVAIHGRAAEAELLKKQQKEIIKEQQKDTQNVLLDKLSQGKLGVREVLNSNLEPFGEGSKETFIKLLKAKADEKTKPIRTDSGLYSVLWDRIHLQDGDPNKLVDENELNKYANRGLKISDLILLRKEMQGKNSSEEGANEAKLKKGVADIVKKQLTQSNPLLGIKDPEGDAQYQSWLSNYLKRYKEQRDAGKSADQLTTPTSPDYLGNDAPAYKRSNQQIMKDLVKSNNTTAAPLTTNGQPPQQPPVQPPKEPRKPGESAANYLKRIGK